MKSFKALVTLLTLAAALSCGANGSPTNVTTDSFIKRQSKQELQNIVNPNSLQRIVNAANHAAKSNTDFTMAVVGRLSDNSRHYNYAICSVGRCDYTFNGKKGENWAHTNVVGYGSLSFDLVIGGAGTFTPKQGGNSNWAWAWKGYVTKRQRPNDQTVHFANPGSSDAQLSGGQSA